MCQSQRQNKTGMINSTKIPKQKIPTKKISPLQNTNIILKIETQ